MNAKIWLSSPHMGGAEERFVQEAFDSNWVAPLGDNVNGFQRDLETFTGAKQAVTLASGTAALHLALILLGVQSGDTVVCQSLTFSASANPILYMGATPFFVDSEADTWNMDPALLEDTIEGCIGKGKPPKAIIPVHLYGMPARLDEIMTVAARHGVPVVEDAAESLGSRYRGRATGTFGRLGVLSFNGNKIITTSGGGALISDDRRLIEKAQFLATQARDDAPHYQHSQIGYNYRMSNILAGIGRGQMQVLEKRVERRREINRWYRKRLSGVAGIDFHSEPDEGFFSNFWLTAVTIDPALAGVDREAVRLGLQAENIESRPLWKPMHLQPVFRDAPARVNGTSAALFEKGLCLPSGSNMTDADLDRIDRALHKIFRP